MPEHPDSPQLRDALIRGTVSSLSRGCREERLAELIGFHAALSLFFEEANERRVTADPVAELARHATIETLQGLDRDTERGGEVGESFGGAAVAFDVTDERRRDADLIGERAQRKPPLFAQEANGVADGLNVRRECERALGHGILKAGGY
jgi:hypothetical protein